MASLWESLEALKEVELADSEILEIMSDSVDEQTNGSLFIPKTLSHRNKFAHELPTEVDNINAETPSVRNNPKSLRQGSPRLLGTDAEILKGKGEEVGGWEGGEGVLYVGHHDCLGKKILGFKWSKKAEITFEINFYQYFKIFSIFIYKILSIFPNLLTCL